jgi:regulator of sigma E protease
MTLFYFIIVLGLLIFAHELGHFILAKRAGICVEVFSLGFGPRLFGFKRGDTDYRVSAFPLGGYVKMLGEDREEEVRDPRAFPAKSVWSRVKVVAAGPLMNIALCAVFMPLVFMVGKEEPVFLTEPPILMDVRADSPAARSNLEKGDRIVSIDGKEVGTWEEVLNRILLEPGSELLLRVDRDGNLIDTRVVVGELPEIRGGYLGIEPMLFLGNEAVIDGVRPSGPAFDAGLKKGDRVTSFAGQKVIDWLDLSSKVDAHGDQEAKIVVDRQGQLLAFTVRPIYNERYDRWIIGISKNRLAGMPMTVRRYGFFQSIVAGTKENIKLAALTLGVLKKLVTLKLSYKILGGPIAIAKTSAAAAASGLASFLYFLAFLSLQLAILNFLPIPVLDGGQLVFLGIEGARGRPVSAKVMNTANQIGFMLLIALMLLITINDIERTWGISSLIKKMFAP